MVPGLRFGLKRRRYVGPSLPTIRGGHVLSHKTSCIMMHEWVIIRLREQDKHWERSWSFNSLTPGTSLTPVVYSPPSPLCEPALLPQAGFFSPDSGPHFLAHIEGVDAASLTTAIAKHLRPADGGAGTVRISLSQSDKVPTTGATTTL
jgi:hypothetical protein